MTYDQTLQYLYAQLPMYQRIGPAAYKADLKYTVDLCELLGNPQNKFRSIHIAGTNGKGSVAHIMASVLQEAGLKTGLYTSPHLKDFRERIRINGNLIPQKRVVDFVSQYKANVEEINPSFFEWTVGLAFHYFSEEKVDIAVLETGMGGRLDSTNVVTPEVSVITNISFDHTQFLGDSLDKIAVEKAGIIKLNVPVVIGESHPETEPVFRSIAKKRQSTICFADQELPQTEYATDLTGAFQSRNIRTALMALNVLNNKNPLTTEEHISSGLQKVRKNTGFTGRWQQINDNPTIICDIGHNRDGIAQTARMIELTPYDNLHIVLGLTNDKKPEDLLSSLPQDARYYFCQAEVPRAMEVDQLVKAAGAIGLHGTPHPTVASALKKAREQASAEDLIFVGGSTFVVAELDL